MQKIKKIKKTLYVVGALLIIILAVILFKNGKNDKQTIIAKIGDFKNQVSVSGRVIPASSVDLAFKNNGRVERVYYSLNTTSSQFVKSGSILAQIEAKDARKELHDAEIDLENKKLALVKLQLAKSAENMSDDLQQAYDDGFVAVSDTFLDLSPILDGLDDILNENNVSDSVIANNGSIAREYKDKSEKLYYQAQKAFDLNKKSFRLLTLNSSKEEIEKNINDIYDTTKIVVDAIKNAKNLMDYLTKENDNQTEYADSKDTLYEYANTTNEHLSELLTAKTEIKDKQDAFLNTDLEIQSLKLDIKQKENAVNEAKDKLEDYYIRAPFDGVITKIDAKVGEIVSSDTPLITMMSKDVFQIESYVPEVNIAQIKIGDMADVTLDAYGESVIFSATIISIDQAETIKDGVSNYKTKFQFTTADDRIKSGMTANVSIITFNKPNVIAIPGGVVFEKEGKKFVQVEVNKKIIEKEIILGNASSLGQVEVISGLEDGDVIILNPIIDSSEIK